MRRTIAPLAIQRQHAMRHQADAQTERNQIHDDVETVEFHGRLDEPTLRPEPVVQPAPGESLPVNQQPALIGKMLLQLFHGDVVTAGANGKPGGAMAVNSSAKRCVTLSEGGRRGGGQTKPASRLPASSDSRISRLVWWVTCNWTSG